METLTRAHVPARPQPSGAASAGPQPLRAHVPARPQPKEPVSDPAPSPEPGPEPRQPGPAPSTEPMPEQDPSREDADTTRSGLGRAAERAHPER